MRTLPLLFAIGAFGACSASPTTDPRVTDVENARERWAAEGSRDYSWTVSRSCNCPGGPVRVTVADGLVIEATRESTDAEGGSESLAPAEYGEFFTVEGLFDMIDRGLREADEVKETAFDPELGYPTRVEIDWETQAADEEDYIVGRDMTLGGATN